MHGTAAGLRLAAGGAAAGLPDEHLLRQAQQTLVKEGLQLSGLMAPAAAPGETGPGCHRRFLNGFLNIEHIVVVSNF